MRTLFFSVKTKRFLLFDTLISNCFYFLKSNFFYEFINTVIRGNFQNIKLIKLFPGQRRREPQVRHDEPNQHHSLHSYDVSLRRIFPGCLSNICASYLMKPWGFSIVYNRRYFFNCFLSVP